MEYKRLVLMSLQDMTKYFPSMTFGEILYSVLRKSVIKEGYSIATTTWLKELTDEQIYNAIEEAILIERED